MLALSSQHTDCGLTVLCLYVVCVSGLYRTTEGNPTRAVEWDALIYLLIKFYLFVNRIIKSPYKPFSYTKKEANAQKWDFKAECNKILIVTTQKCIWNLLEQCNFWFSFWTNTSQNKIKIRYVAEHTTFRPYYQIDLSLINSSPDYHDWVSLINWMVFSLPEASISSFRRSLRIHLNEGKLGENCDSYSCSCHLKRLLLALEVVCWWQLLERVTVYIYRSTVFQDSQVYWIRKIHIHIKQAFEIYKSCSIMNNKTAIVSTTVI